jgi:DNA-binding beta-propeller fold protein YncE
MFFLLLISLTTRLVAQEPPEEAETRAQMAIAEKLLDKTPDHGAVLFFLATSQAQLQQLYEATETLKQCIALKEGFDPQGEPTFAALRDSENFKKLIEQIHKDFPAVTQAEPAFTTTEKDLVPEGLAFDPTRDVFYLSSMHRKKIVQISADGKVTDFVPSDRYNLLPVLGIRVSPIDGTLWSNSWVENGKTELLHFDKAGVLLGRYPPPDDRKHGFNDLVVLFDGNVLLTDTTAHKVYRFDTKANAFTELKLSRALLMPNGIALADSGLVVYVADQLGVIRLDLSSGQSAEVAPGPHSTLAGADGLYWHNGRLVAVQNGIGTPRIAVFQLAADGLHVTKTTVMEYRSRFTVLPTTGAFKGDDFYFIENSQLDNLNGDRVLDATKLEPVRIAKLHIP